jgi:general stress protein 26
MAKQDELTREEKIEKLGGMIQDIRMAMLTTADPDGQLRSRPMATLRHEFDGRLYFFTKESSGKVESIEQDQHVNLAYSNPEKQHYVSVTGRGAISRDHAQMKELWNPMMKAFFPEGLEDPELALLTVQVDSAELWDSPPSMIVKMVGLAEALVTGKSYDQLHGNNDLKVDLKGSQH